MRIPGFLKMSAVLFLLASMAAAAPGGVVPAPSARPILKTDSAIYNLDKGVLQYAFTFTNPTDTVLYLDCQVPPRARLAGDNLVLAFDRSAPPEPDSASTAAGGPVAGPANPDDFPPQRVGAHQTFQGSRRLDRLPGGPLARPRFDKLQLEIAFYPEQELGDAKFQADKKGVAAAPPKAVIRKGKVPPPMKPKRFKVPKENFGPSIKNDGKN
jgi:hypothetical protein